MILKNDKFVFEDEDFKNFSCGGKKLYFLHFDKIKEDYTKLRSLREMPKSCDYVLILGKIKENSKTKRYEKRHEIWLIEEKDIVCDLIQRLVKYERENKGIDNEYEHIFEVIKKFVGKVIHDFVYSILIIYDILNCYGLSLSDLNDRRNCNIQCLVLYSKKPPNRGFCTHENYKRFYHVVELLIYSLGNSIFVTEKDLCDFLLPILS
jgi:hypothetical protein